MSYTVEKHAQIIIALFKAHNIRRVIASPGTTNMAFVGSVQNDPYFEVYSAVDERSAAYMACGLAAETNEPVVLSCTGATASRNYLPGLTEAFYRKLPVIALTSMQGRARAGHHIAQVIDRSALPADVVKLSVDLPIVKDGDDIWECETKVNRAILETHRHGGGPVHINLPTVYSHDFSVKKLPDYRKMERWTSDDKLPALSGRVGVFVGAHKTWTSKETAALDTFCEMNNAVVFCDHTSGYFGKYRFLSALIGGQEGPETLVPKPDIMIHIGEVSGDYQSASLCGKSIWRVSPDGEIRDAFRKLRHVFEMTEHSFFSHYSQQATKDTSYFEECKKTLSNYRAKVPDLPFSNLWIASKLSSQIPEGSVVHFAILNSLRAWNFFDLPKNVQSFSNVGGFGIDGCMSSLIGASLADPDKLYFLITGDLAFFYDMNSLGNRHVGSNIRILLVNNGRGTEFTQHNHPGAAYGDGARKFIAAEGHFGEKSPELVRNYAEALGMDYFAFSNKSDCKEAASRLFATGPSRRPMIIEAFVNADDESDALKKIKNLAPSKKHEARQVAKKVLGAQKINKIKKMIK